MATYSSVWNLILDKLAPGTNITALKHQDVEKALLDFAEAQWLVGDIKEVDCTNQYITDNFDSSGKGKNERLGWAICNGNNGTRNRTGRVSVAYGNVTPLDSTNTSQFTAMGTTGSPTIGGSKDAVLVSHTHYTVVYGSEQGNNTNSLKDGNGASRYEQGLSARAFDTGSDAFDYELATDSGTINAGKTSVAGTANNAFGVDKNMQPYIVTLFIQKIPIV